MWDRNSATGKGSMANLLSLSRFGIHRKTQARSCAYPHNIDEQNRRSVKRRAGAILGFKRFANASIFVSGIELVAKFRKGQVNVARLLKRVPRDVSNLWIAVLVA
jgi:transposase-like protein